jgi:hypothetical protein
MHKGFAELPAEISTALNVRLLRWELLLPLKPI